MGIKNPLPKTYVPAEHEAKWQEAWQRWGLHSFNREDKVRQTYSIDTPPPYPSGEFHLGNALNWCYIDFVARYKRMRGFNVHFPQGWDCHGLPTEVRAEKLYGIRKRDVPLQEFKEICIRLTDDYIEKMRAAMKAMGYSMDWSLEYRTMDPTYYRATQLSFIILYERGYIYRGEHPVNWCPRCETAIAEAEVVYSERESELVYLYFDPEGVRITIATTRPELLPACVAVAVNPNDERYRPYLGLEVEVPIFKRRVKILADDDVDPKFGTGVVMVCTFGDKTDVKWQKKYGLPVVNLVTEDGRLSDDAGDYAGLNVGDARANIITDLKKKGLLYKSEKISQSVGCCWRCHTPVEIISRRQWFMRTRDMTDQVLEWTDKVNWIPSFSKHRMIDWARSLDWDWVISRQRVFATPIPVWYCKRCGQVLVAKKEWLPVDPRFEKPRELECPNCGGAEFTGESDVMDTWMDSSITCAVHAGWPDNEEHFNRLFPADLQPNGLDIIRTWDYYLMVKHLALFGEAPYKTVLVNGMVRGADGRMMHKSFGNYVEAFEAISKYGADSIRQWAAGGAATGYDLQFNWGEIEYGKRFLTKLWNAARFIHSNLIDYEDGEVQLELIDRWLMSKLQKLTSTVTEAYESFQFNMALEAIRDFTWHILCDQYLEAVKHRLYRTGLESSRRKAAQYTLYHSLLRIIQLLAPICPHICEAIYQVLPLKENLPRSIHLNPWPQPDSELISGEAESCGDAILAVIAEVRRIKSERHISLKQPIDHLKIYVADELFSAMEASREDIGEVLHSMKVEVEILSTDSFGREVKDHPNIRVDIKI
ncbi:MAG: valine--tRNA ligase [Candidatus Bathyarchaeia archaeon]